MPKASKLSVIPNLFRVIAGHLNEHREEEFDYFGNLKSSFDEAKDEATNLKGSYVFIAVINNNDPLQRYHVA